MVEWKDMIFTQPKNNVRFVDKRLILVCTECGNVEPAWVEKSTHTIKDADGDDMAGIVRYWAEFNGIEAPRD